MPARNVFAPASSAPKTATARAPPAWRPVLSTADAEQARSAGTESGGSEVSAGTVSAPPRPTGTISAATTRERNSGSGSIGSEPLVCEEDGCRDGGHQQRRHHGRPAEALVAAFDHAVRQRAHRGHRGHLSDHVQPRGCQPLPGSIRQEDSHLGILDPSGRS
ncbi:hypothetical protein [Streptomyces sp. NPDC007063]|uniref:hypothetical protein n=1 Tax=Streptomyces sp. NPDC007063 TaxID=3364772 RepID=UPI00367E7B93